VQLLSAVAGLGYQPKAPFKTGSPHIERLSKLITYTPGARRHSSAVEQLFRKSLAVCAVLQAWEPDTNGHTYQLFVSRGIRPGSPLRPVLRSSRR
jgi:hypothetical protein